MGVDRKRPTAPNMVLSTRLEHPLIWINPDACLSVSVRLIIKPCRLQVHHQEEDHVMSNDRIPEKPEMNTGPIGGGLKRRDLLWT